MSDRIAITIPLHVAEYLRRQLPNRIERDESDSEWNAERNDGTPREICEALAREFAADALAYRAVLDAIEESLVEKPMELHDWARRYELIGGSGQDCCAIDGLACGFPNWERAVDLAQSMGLGKDHVWTIRYDDGEEDDDDSTWTITPGMGVVNVVGYVVTKRRPEGKEFVQWD